MASFTRKEEGRNKEKRKRQQEEEIRERKTKGEVRGDICKQKVGREEGPGIM